MQPGARRCRVWWVSGEHKTTAGQRANVCAHCRRQLRLVSRADTANLSAGDTLVPVFSPGTTRRDVALAYYKGLLEGKRRLWAVSTAHFSFGMLFVGMS